MKKAILSVIFSLAFVLPVVGLADNATTSATTTQRELKTQIRELKQEYSERLKQTREEFQNKIQAIKEELKTKLEDAKNKLQVKLEKIKDRKKADSVQKINDQLQKLNERWTDHFTDVLGHLSDVLMKISTRTDKLSASGINVVSVVNAMNTASSTIASARTAVATQAAKVYTITITTDKNLKTDVGKSRQALHSDLVKLRDVVFGARNAVHNAVQELEKVATSTHATSTNEQ